MEKDKVLPVQDYWKFMRELKARLDLVCILERQFFVIDDMCESAVKVGNCSDAKSVCSLLSSQQAEVYSMLCDKVKSLNAMLSEGRSCFNLDENRS